MPMRVVTNHRRIAFRANSLTRGGQRLDADPGARALVCERETPAAYAIGDPSGDLVADDARPDANDGPVVSFVSSQAGDVAVRLEHDLGEEPVTRMLLEALRGVGELGASEPGAQHELELVAVQGYPGPISARPMPASMESQLESGDVARLAPPDCALPITFPVCSTTTAVFVAPPSTPMKIVESELDAAFAIKSVHFRKPRAYGRRAVLQIPSALQGQKPVISSAARPGRRRCAFAAGSNTDGWPRVSQAGERAPDTSPRLALEPPTGRIRWTRTMLRDESRGEFALPRRVT